MPGTYQYNVEIKSNVAKLLSDMKQVQNRLDIVEGREYTIKLNIDEKKLSNVISNLEKMLDSLGKGTGDFKQFENLSKELSSIVSEVQSLSKAFGKVDDSGAKTLLSSIQNIDKSLSELSQNILNVNKNMSNMGGNTSGAVKQVENISNAYQDAAKEAEKLADAQSKIGQKTNISSVNSDYKSQRKGMKLEYFDGYTDKYDESINAYEQNVVRVVETTDKFAVDAEISCAKAETAVQKFVDSIGNQFPGLQSELNSIKENMSELSDLPYADGANSFGFEPTSDGKGWYVYLNVLKEVQDQAEKTTQAVKEVSSTASQDQTKDAFPDKDISTSVESATNSIKEENNILEQNTQKVKENADAKKKLTDTDKEVSNVNLSKYDNRLESYTKKTSGYDTTIARFENGGWTSDTYKQRINAVKEAVKQYADILNNLKKHPELVNDEELGKLDKQERLIKDNIIAVQNMSAAEKGYSLISAQKELDKINNILKEHSGMSREAKNQIKAYYAEIKSGNPSASLDVIHGKIMQIVNAEIEAGRGGKSMFDAIKEKAWYGVASAIGTYFGFNDLIRYGKEGVSIVRQLDTAFTEMRKVSNESVQSLKKYQDTTFDTADAVGTTAKQIQNSTADWMRLGESMDTAAKSAKDANILLNVSEFEGIDEATESLVSMSQAYKDLDKMDIIDVLNNIGNNYSISTDGLATALKDSASALVTANNDLNEAVSLTTAGNAITQDPSKVGAGLRTISLRLVGTEEAKEELSDLGEETDGMITTVSKLRNTIQSATSAATKDGKGFDIFDSNGNYKSTYEIMQGLADLYDEIVKKDKELGTNNLNLLLETIAGKNRSNIAASILQNGDMLRSVYEDAQNSEGSAEKELNSYLDSVDGKFQQLQNRTQEFWYNVIDTTTVKSVLDFTTDLTEGASKFFKLVEKHLPTILGAIATIIASNKSGGLIRLINFINNSPFLATVEFNREVYELIV